MMQLFTPSRTAFGVGLVALALAAVLPAWLAGAQEPARAMPAPAIDIPAGPPGLQTATFAGGCFWGVQGVFEHIKGVRRAVSGYAGGTVATPSYEQVSGGGTGHAESVQVTFDPAVVSYGRLLQIFFSVALDPTEIDRQGPDSGTQYRSELFVAGRDQDKVARAYIAQLDGSHLFARRIATRVDAAGPFYPAEAYHQDYLTLHPTAPYIAFNDIPKVESLKALFPQAWVDAPVRVGDLASAE